MFISSRVCILQPIAGWFLISSELLRRGDGSVFGSLSAHHLVTRIRWTGAASWPETARPRWQVGTGRLVGSA
jgi:hypothetical protein